MLIKKVTDTLLSDFLIIKQTKHFTVILLIEKMERSFIALVFMNLKLRFARKIVLNLTKTCHLTLKVNKRYYK